MSRSKTLQKEFFFWKQTERCVGFQESLSQVTYGNDWLTCWMVILLDKKENNKASWKKLKLNCIHILRLLMPTQNFLKIIMFFLLLFYTVFPFLFSFWYSTDENFYLGHDACSFSSHPRFYVASTKIFFGENFLSFNMFLSLLFSFRLLKCFIIQFFPFT